MYDWCAFSGEYSARLQYRAREFAAHGAGARNVDGWCIAHSIDGDV